MLGSGVLMEHGIDQTIRREVEAILAFDLASCISLERDIDQVATGATGRIEGSGTQWGPYKLGTPGMFIEVSAEVLRRRVDLDEALKQIQEAMKKSWI